MMCCSNHSSIIPAGCVSIFVYVQVVLLLTERQLDCASSEGELKSLKEEYQKLLDAGLGPSTEWLSNEDEILEKIPVLARENIHGWQALYSSDGGWLAAAKAINAIGIYLKDQGVSFGVGG